MRRFSLIVPYSNGSGRYQIEIESNSFNVSDTYFCGEREKREPNQINGKDKLLLYLPLLIQKYTDFYYSLRNDDVTNLTRREMYENVFLR